MHELPVSAQRAQAISKSVDSAACQAEGRGIRLAEFLGTKRGTHQTRRVVIGGAEEHVTDLVSEHASERTRQLVIQHDSGHRRPARRSTRQEALGRIQRDTNRPPVRRIRRHGDAAEDRRRFHPQAPLELALETRVQREAVRRRFSSVCIVGPFEPNTIRLPDGCSFSLEAANNKSRRERWIDAEADVDLETLADIRMKSGDSDRAQRAEEGHDAQESHQNFRPIRASMARPFMPNRDCPGNAWMPLNDSKGRTAMAVAMARSNDRREQQSRFMVSPAAIQV